MNAVFSSLILLLVAVIAIFSLKNRIALLKADTLKPAAGKPQRATIDTPQKALQIIRNTALLFALASGISLAATLVLRQKGYIVGAMECSGLIFTLLVALLLLFVKADIFRLIATVLLLASSIANLAIKSMTMDYTRYKGALLVLGFAIPVFFILLGINAVRAANFLRKDKA